MERTYAKKLTYNTFTKKNYLAGIFCYLVVSAYGNFSYKVSIIVLDATPLAELIQSKLNRHNAVIVIISVVMA